MIVETGAGFNSIGEAMGTVEAGQTIRVSGSGIYRGPVAFVQKNHRDVTLESTQGATIRCRAGVGHLITVINIPGVKVRGFTLSNGEAARGRSYASCR